MLKFIPLQLPSALYRGQIKNLTARMRALVTETVLYPLRNMNDFNKAEKGFNAAEDAASLCCSVMDNASSIGSGDRADNAVTALMREMVHHKNDASDLVENEPNETLEGRKDSI